MQPFVLLLIDIELRPKGPLIQSFFRPLIDDSPFITWKRRPILVAFKEILSNFRANVLKQEPQVCGDRIIAQNGMAGLGKIMESNNNQRRHQHRQGDKNAAPVSEQNGQNCEPGAKNHRHSYRQIPHFKHRTQVGHDGPLFVRGRSQKPRQAEFEHD